MDLTKIEQFCKMTKENALFMAKGKNSHFGGGMSIIEILSVLYGGVMNYDVENPNLEKRDRFILSKGHGVLGYYSALTTAGFLSRKDLSLFEQTNGFLPGHPVKNIDKGIEFSTGSLGMGISIAVGVALAFKKQNKSNKVYVLLGDGECNEGSVWEAFTAASKYRLDNLFIIIDNNNFQLGGRINEISDINSLAQKLYSFGLNVKNVDGHNLCELYDAFTKDIVIDLPTAIIAKTKKGHGFSFSENNNDYHHIVLTEKNYNLAIEEMNGE